MFTVRRRSISWFGKANFLVAESASLFDNPIATCRTEGEAAMVCEALNAMPWCQPCPVGGEISMPSGVVLAMPPGKWEPLGGGRFRRVA